MMKQFKRKVFSFFLLTLLFNTLSCQKQQTQNHVEKRPNIIVFMVDDMGWMDTSVPFLDSMMPLNELYHTPHMETLAREGVKFSAAYAQPVCTPTRVSYLTGMNAARTHITNWISPLQNQSTDAHDDQFSPPAWNWNGMNKDGGTERTLHATPFPILLREEGYHTIHIGKAHWGSAGTPGSDPLNLGFMVNVAGHAGGHPQSYLSEDRYGNIPGKTRPQAVPDLEEYYDSGIFLTEALTREAIKALEKPIDEGEPFFLNFSHYALHTPIMADIRFVQKYYDAGIDSIEAKYASLIEGMDKSLGDIMQYLEKNNQLENTIIIFMSDNGGLDHHQRGGAVNTHNFPLRSGKGSVYEGGIRVPMIVKWPGSPTAGSTHTKPVIIEDFFPSILEMARIETTEFLQNTDGRSFVPVLQPADAAKENAEERPLIFHYPHKWINISPDENLGINYYSALRLGKWKLIYRMRDQSFELYDLTEDIREQNELSKTHPEKIKELASLLGRTLKSRKAQMPIFKDSGHSIPFPDDIISSK